MVGKVSRNDITGDAIKTKGVSAAYESNFDNIFRKPKETADILILDDPAPPSYKLTQRTEDSK